MLAQRYHSADPANEVTAEPIACTYNSLHYSEKQINLLKSRFLNVQKMHMGIVQLTNLILLRESNSSDLKVYFIKKLKIIGMCHLKTYPFE